MNLSGTWDFLPDESTSLEALSPEGWTDVSVPSNWHLAGLPNHEGTVWYRRRFDAEPQDGLAPHLVFEGVDYFADVWLNGVFLGHHEGYFAPFRYEVAHALRAGANELFVRVEAPREDPADAWPYRKRLIKGIFNHHDCRPGAWHPRYGQDGNTGGIWNDVRLEWRPAPYLADLRTLVSRHGEAATVVVHLELAGITRATRLPVRVVCRDPDGAVVAEVTDSCEVRPGEASLTLGLRVDAPRWWWSWEHGDQPLYSLEVSLGEDRLVRPLGFRTIRQEKDGWYLNDRRVFLRGTNVIPAQWLSTYTPALIDEDVRLMKEAGLNIVRVHAHVNRPEFYEACDRAGLMVWQDFSLQWSYDPSAGFAALAVRQIKDMVRHLRHHPAIVAWCCHNEPVGQENTLDPLLVQAVLAEDASRVLRSHSDFQEHPYQGWYYGHMHEYAALPGQPLVTEFGAQALPAVETLAEMFAPEDLWPPNWERWAYHDFQYEQTFWIAGVEQGPTLASFVTSSQQKQAEILRYAIDRYRRARFEPIHGVFQFMLVDGWPSITWSVVDHLRRPKLGYRTLQEVCSPVYLSVRLNTGVVRSGLPLPVDLVLVNDLHLPLEGQVRFSLLDSSGQEVRRWEAKPCAVGPDASVSLTRAWADVLDTDPAWRGDYRLQGVFESGRETLSRVHVPVRLEQLPEGLERYKSVEML